MNRLTTRREALLGTLAAFLPVAASGQEDGGPSILVVGNDAFVAQDLLANPWSDAVLVAEALYEAGYSVSTILNADKETFHREFDAFLTRSRSARRTFLYLAGHGVEAGGDNVLLPAGGNDDWRSEQDALDNGIRVSRILKEVVESGTSAFAAFIDACRNNPFEGRWGAGRGFTPVALSDVLVPVRASTEGATGLLPAGALLSYSTQPGKVALDGQGENSPYAIALSEIIRREPTVSVGSALDRLEARVMALTGGFQAPWSECTMELTSSLL